MDLGQLVFKIGFAHALAIVRLLAINIDRRTVLDNRLDKFDAFIHLPSESIVIIVNQHRFRPAFAGHLKRRCDKIVLVLAIHN